MMRWLAFVCLFATTMLAQQTGKTSVAATPGFQISGIVVDSGSNQPLAHARVAIAPVTQRDDFTTVLTGEDGRFIFPGLSAGKYMLTAQHRGYITQSFNQHGKLSSSIVVGPSLDSGHLVFPMTIESVIAGFVTDEQGEAVRSERVILFQSIVDEGTVRTTMSGSTMTDDEGHYHFSHLRAGRYFIAVSAQPWYAQRPQPRMKVTHANGTVSYFSGYVDDAQLKNAQNVVIEEPTPSPLDVTYPTTFYGGATDDSAATPILLSRGEKFSADISLQPVPAAHWQIASPQGMDKHFIVILQQKLFGVIFQPFLMPRRSRPGALEYVGLPPGQFYFSGTNSTVRVEQDFNVANGVIENEVSATMVPVTATVRFEPAAALSGQISLQLHLKNSHRGASEPINGNGEIKFKHPIWNGTYAITVQGEADIYIRSVQATGAKITGGMLEVKGDSPVKLNVVLAGGRGDITGIALRGDKSLAGAMVMLVPVDPANNQILFRRDQSNSDGSFSLPAVVPGRYTLLAIADGWDMEWANPAVLAKFLPQGEPITVESKGKYSVKVKVQ